LLGVTRAAVWKQLKQLEQSGLRVESVRGKGYKLAAGTELLNKNKIVSMLETMHFEAAKNFHLDIFHSVTSTNDLAMEKAQAEPCGRYHCLAEYQIAGRGRRGRQWISPFGCNLYLSSSWRTQGGAGSLAGLSLAIGIGVLNALRQLGANGVQLKWPNDLLWHGSKLGGILVEVSGDLMSDCAIATGIGINLDMPREAEALIEQNIVDLKRVIGRSISKNQLAVNIIVELEKTLKRFERSGFKSFLPEWYASDGFLDQRVRLVSAQESVCGIARGVDENGALLLEINGRLIPFSGGELSLRCDDRAGN
jgi:BirA family biotin operon repressor/biotin-[acetyl-CoA-carboxylase] ligase